MPASGPIVPSELVEQLFQRFRTIMHKEFELLVHLVDEGDKAKVLAQLKEVCWEIVKQDTFNTW